MTKTALIRARVTPEQRKKLEEIVERTGIGDISDHVRKAIDEYVQRHEANDAPADGTAGS